MFVERHSRPVIDLDVDFELLEIPVAEDRIIDQQEQQQPPNDGVDHDFTPFLQVYLKTV